MSELAVGEVLFAGHKRHSKDPVTSAYLPASHAVQVPPFSPA